MRTLERLLHFPDVATVLQACAATEEPLWTSCPRAGLLVGREARYMESDPPYGELALVCPDGQMLHPLDWQNEQPVPLLKNVQRLTAPNPGVMTGPGTNSYLVGDPRTGYIVIDRASPVVAPEQYDRPLPSLRPAAGVAVSALFGGQLFPTRQRSHQLALDGRIAGMQFGGALRVTGVEAAVSQFHPQLRLLHFQRINVIRQRLQLPLFLVAEFGTGGWT